jgi:hypothetical protein
MSLTFYVPLSAKGRWQTLNTKYTCSFQAAQALKQPEDVDKSSQNRLSPEK